MEYKNIKKASKEFMKELMQLGAVELNGLKRRTQIEAGLLNLRESKELEQLFKIASEFGYISKDEESSEESIIIGLCLSFLQRDSQEPLFEVQYSQRKIPEAFRLRTDKSYSYQDKKGHLIKLPANVEKQFIHCSKLSDWLEKAVF